MRKASAQVFHADVVVKYSRCSHELTDIIVRIKGLKGRTIDHREPVMVFEQIRVNITDPDCFFPESGGKDKTMEAL